MKKLQCIFLLSVFLSALMFCGYIETHYTRKGCEVVSIDGDTVRIKDKCGYVWEWEQEQDENFTEGEKINLKMHTNGTTSNINDDKILKVMR